MGKIKVLVVEAGKPGVVKEIAEGLDAMQEVVGGNIEIVGGPIDGTDIILNDVGKLIGLPPNRVLLDKDGDVYDYIAGTFYLCGFDEEGASISLTDSQIKELMHYYRNPQIITMGASRLGWLARPEAEILLLAMKREQEKGSYFVCQLDKELQARIRAFVTRGLIAQLGEAKEEDINNAMNEKISTLIGIFQNDYPDDV